MGRKFTYEEVKKFIEGEGYTLLSREYINSHTKMLVRCPKGHEYYVRFSKFKRGQRCSACIRNKKLTYEEVKSFIENVGYTLLSTEYKNAKTKLKMRCSNGHIYYATLDSIKRGYRCSKCSNRAKYTIDEIKKLVENYNYVLLSNECKNNKSKIKLKCPNGHIYECTLTNFLRGFRCRQCYVSNNRGMNHPNWDGGYHKNKIPKYDTYAHQLDWCEEVRRDPEDQNILQVRCYESSCKKWFVPSLDQVTHRIRAINGNLRGEHHFYCSDECKNRCSVYGRRKYPKNFEYNELDREVQPELRDIVFERDDWTCQKCGTNEDIQCHHIIPVKIEPIESADIDNCITLCKKFT